MWLLLALVPATMLTLWFASRRAERGNADARDVGGRPRWPTG